MKTKACFYNLIPGARIAETPAEEIPGNFEAKEKSWKIRITNSG
jgi:hypothetical protein